MRDFIAEVLRLNGVAEECAADIVAAASEACANVIDHGDRAATYDTRAWLQDNICTVEVTDPGPGFDPVTVPIPTSDAESGRGILLMRALVDQVTFGHAPDGGITVRLRKRLGRLPMPASADHGSPAAPAASH